MIYLRIIQETRESENDPFNQVIENFELGKSYSILKKGNTKEFDEAMKKGYPDVDKSNIRALLFGENGDEFFIEEKEPNKVYHYFIMSESGQTFERL